MNYELTPVYDPDSDSNCICGKIKIPIGKYHSSTSDQTSLIYINSFKYNLHHNSEIIIDNGSSFTTASDLISEVFDIFASSISLHLGSSDLEISNRIKIEITTSDDILICSKVLGTSNQKQLIKNGVIYFNECDIKNHVNVAGKIILVKFDSICDIQDSNCCSSTPNSISIQDEITTIYQCPPSFVRVPIAKIPINFTCSNFEYEIIVSSYPSNSQEVAENTKDYFKIINAGYKSDYLLIYLMKVPPNGSYGITIKLLFGNKIFSSLLNFAVFYDTDCSLKIEHIKNQCGFDRTGPAHFKIYNTELLNGDININVKGYYIENKNVTEPCHVPFDINLNIPANEDYTIT